MNKLFVVALVVCIDALCLATVKVGWRGTNLHIEGINQAEFDWQLSLKEGPVCDAGRAIAGRKVLKKVAFDQGLVLTTYQKSAGKLIENSYEIPRKDHRSKLGPVDREQVIYQLPVRTYLAKGLGAARSGKFSYLTDEKIITIKELGVDVVWLTGILEQASYADTDPDVVKGNAGSYYAIRDYWDVSPQLGEISELVELIERFHRAGLRVLIDFVVNHTARVTKTDVLCKKHLDFGRSDDKGKFFDNQNNYFYVLGATFEPPYIENPGADGVFDTDIDLYGIQKEQPAKVTGNNVESPRPSKSDWFETAKLNYGYEFTTGYTDYEPLPKTWSQMVDVAKYWLNLGVDGFRVDFAHTVPVEFWGYFVQKVREFQPNTYLIAEAYEDGMGAPGFSYDKLFEAGFDSVYNSKLYWALHNVARGHGGITETQYERSYPGGSSGMARGDRYTNYLENHDEVRLSSAHFSRYPANSVESMRYGYGMVKYAAFLPSNFLLQGGQEIGESAEVFGPFAGDNGRTSIFDFVYQSEVLKFFKGQASSERLSLREDYQKILLLKRRLFSNARGVSTVRDIPTEFIHGGRGRVSSYLRRSSEGVFFVVGNFGQQQTRTVSLHLTSEDNADSHGLLGFLGVNSKRGRYLLTELTSREGWSPKDPNIVGSGVPASVLFKSSGVPSGMYIGDLLPGEVLLFKFSRL